MGREAGRRVWGGRDPAEAAVRPRATYPDSDRARAAGEGAATPLGRSAAALRTAANRLPGGAGRATRAS